MKAAGEHVRLRVAFGEVPPAGVVLQLPTGRRYWVFYASGKTLHCRVMASGEAIPTICRGVIPWRWAGRGRSKRVGSGAKPIAQLIAEASLERKKPAGRAFPAGRTSRPE